MYVRGFVVDTYIQMHPQGIPISRCIHKGNFHFVFRSYKSNFTGHRDIKHVCNEHKQKQPNSGDELKEKFDWGVHRLLKTRMEDLVDLFLAKDMHASFKSK